jgi:hypothetical protein
MEAFTQKLPGEVLALRWGKLPPHRWTRRVVVGYDEWSRLAATKRALDTLRSGGFVYLAVDGWGRERLDPPHEGLGPLRVGAFALAEVANAPLLPVTACWRGRKLEIVTGDLIAPGARSEMAGAFIRWLDGYLRENPREIRRSGSARPSTSRLAEALFEERPQLGVADLSVLGPGDRTGWEDADAVRREAQGGDDLAGDFGGYLLG